VEIDHRATHWMLLKLACFKTNPDDPQAAFDELLQELTTRAVRNLDRQRVVTDEEIQAELDSLVRAYVDREVGDAFRASGYARRLDEVGEIVWRQPSRKVNR
jgi:hypothetical protein